MPSKKELTKEDRLLMAMKNAEAIAQTLCHHGTLMGELQEQINELKSHITTLRGEMANLKSLYHRSLVNKYGTGPTT